MKLIIKEIPPSANKFNNLHWAEKAKIKQDWEWLIFQEATEMRLFNRKLTSVEILVQIYFADQRRRDFDNYMAFKGILDGLKKARVIIDDNYKVVKRLSYEFYVDKENPRTEIILEPK